MSPEVLEKRIHETIQEDPRIVCPMDEYVSSRLNGEGHNQ